LTRTVNNIDRPKTIHDERVRRLTIEIEKRDRHLGILAEVAGRIHGEDNVEVILNIMLDEVLRSMGLKAAWVFMGDEKEKRLRLAASRGVAAPYLDHIRTHGLDSCLCPEVFGSGHRMVARNTTQCPRMPTIVEGLQEPVAHACIPLRLEGESRGVLNVAARPGDQFSEEELRFLETLGHQVCIAVERARHLGAERLRNYESRTLAAISKAIGSSLDADAVIKAVGASALELLGLDRALILLGSNPAGLRVAHLSGLPHPVLAEGQPVDLVALDSRLQLTALQERRLFFVDDCAQDPRVNGELLRGWGAASAIFAPVLARDQVFGLLVLTCTAPRHWTEGQVEIAETLAAQASVALESARLYQEERLRNREARAMVAITRAIGGSLDVSDVLKAVGRTAREILEVDGVQIFLGSDPRALKVGHLSGLPHSELQEGQVLDLIALGARLLVLALSEGRAFFSNDRDTDPRVSRELARRWDIASSVVVPLLARNQVLGLLSLTMSSPRQWTDEQVELVEALAAQASVALEGARLYQEVQGAYLELKDAQARILQSEKMAVLGTFASGLAHEVRNPLNSIALQLSLLERRIARSQTPPLGELDVVGIIREEIKRLDSLVGDFLLFSRTNRIQYEPTSLDALIDEVVRLLRPEARASGVTLRRQRVGEALASLRMDAEKMKQVVINLVQNAIEAQPNGGLVVVESGATDGRAQIVVRDSGPGLPEGIDVFQLFVTTKDKGTGLGLSIAQQIILQHGGDITAKSERGKGAAFTISLPLEPAGDNRQEGIAQ